MILANGFGARGAIEPNGFVTNEPPQKIVSASRPTRLTETTGIQFAIAWLR